MLDEHHDSSVEQVTRSTPRTHLSNPLFNFQMSGYSVEETSKMNGNFSLEEPRTEYNGYFPKDLPPRPGPPPAASGPFRGRWRSFRTFSLSSFSVIHTPDGAARIRHIAMIAILLLRSAMSGLSILSAVTKGKIPDVIVYSLLAVLTLYFTATCLAIIGDAAGDKCLKGLVVVCLCSRQLSNTPH